MGRELSDGNGIEAARRIRSNYGENSPVLLLLAYEWGGMADKAREAGISGFISKPLFKSTLFDALKACSGTAAEEIVDAEKAVGLKTGRFALQSLRIPRLGITMQLLWMCGCP